MKEYPEDIDLEEGENYCPRIPCDTDKRYIKHVHKAWARFHVLHWDNHREHCSEADCIINKPKEAQNDYR